MIHSRKFSRTSQRRLFWAILSFTMTLAGVASAEIDNQSIPLEERKNIPHRREEGWTQSGIRLAGGVAFNPGLSTGFYGQVDYNYTGPLLGLTLVGLEGWKAKEGWGLGIPSSIYFWFPISIGHGESPALMVSVKGGWNWATFDRVNEQNQFGIFTPTGSVSFGVTTKLVKILVDGQAEYRWHFTGENRAQFRTGLSLIVNLDK